MSRSGRGRADLRYVARPLTDRLAAHQAPDKALAGVSQFDRKKVAFRLCCDGLRDQDRLRIIARLDIANIIGRAVPPLGRTSEPAQRIGGQNGAPSERLTKRKA